MTRIKRKKVDRAVETKTAEAKKQLYSFRIKAGHLGRLKKQADAQNTTVTRLLETMIEQYLLS